MGGSLRLSERWENITRLWTKHDNNTANQLSPPLSSESSFKISDFRAKLMKKFTLRVMGSLQGNFTCLAWQSSLRLKDNDYSSPTRPWEDSQVGSLKSPRNHTHTHLHGHVQSHTHGHRAQLPKLTPSAPHIRVWGVGNLSWMGLKSYYRSTVWNIFSGLHRAVQLIPYNKIMLNWTGYLDDDYWKII